MIRPTWRLACLIGLVAAATFSVGCDDMVRRSIRDGMFTYISGGISSTFNQGGAVNSLLNSVFTGSLFGSGDTTNTGASGT